MVQTAVFKNKKYVKRERRSDSALGVLKESQGL